jgi:hypothetical protein
MTNDQALVDLAECFKVFQEKWLIDDEGNENDDIIIDVSCHIIQFYLSITCHAMSG